MKQFLKRIFSSNALGVATTVLATVIVVCLILFLAIRPMLTSSIINTFASVLLTALSTWLGIVYSNKRAERNAAKKWLPAAEMICNDLLTMNAQLERMCRKQSNGNDAIKTVFPKIPQETISPMMAYMKSRCGYCSENFESLRNGIENAFLNWNIYIDSSGEEKEISETHKRLEARKEALFAAIEMDFPHL